MMRLLFWLSGLARSIRRTPLKVLLYFLALYAVSMLLMYLAEVFFLRRLRTHPRYIEAVADHKMNVISVQHTGGIELDEAPKLLEKSGSKQADIQLHMLLVVDAYVTVPGRRTVKFPICIHEPDADIYISQSLSSGVLYEYEHVQALLSYLTPGSSEGLLDLGANLGVFSLPAVNLGYQVVAVDALPENVLRLRASVLLGPGLQHRLTVVHSALSNQRGTLYPRRSNKNIGGSTVVDMDNCGLNCDKNLPIKAMLLDDLLEVIPFRRGVLKIDIEGHEERAFEHGTQLLDEIDFHTILMEWRFYKNLYRVYSASNRIEKFIKLFTSRDYVPQEVVSGRQLHLYDWGNWPFEIIWRKSRTHQS